MSSISINFTAANMDPISDSIRIKLSEMKNKYQEFLLKWIEENEQDPLIIKYKNLSRLLEGKFEYCSKMSRFVVDGERILKNMIKKYTPQHVVAVIDLCSDEETDYNIKKEEEIEIGPEKIMLRFPEEILAQDHQTSNQKTSSIKARRPSCAALESFGSLQECKVKNNHLKPASIYASTKRLNHQVLHTFQLLIIVSKIFQPII